MGSTLMGKDKSETKTSSGWTDDQQRAAQYLINNYMGQDNDQWRDTRQQAQGVIQNLMQGRPDYNTTNDLEQRYANNMWNNAAKSANAIDAKMGNNYWSSARQKALSTLGEDTQRAIGDKGAELQYNELMNARNRQMQALGLIPNFDPQSKMLQTLGVQPMQTTYIQGQSQGLLPLLTGVGGGVAGYYAMPANPAMGAAAGYMIGSGAGNQISGAYR